MADIIEFERDKDGNPLDDENMTVTLEIDGGDVECMIATILEWNGRDYIALRPINDPRFDPEDVWFYRYSENPDDPNEEPAIDNITDNEEYECVEDKYDEYLDSLMFDEIP